MKMSEVLWGPETWGQGSFHRAGRYCLMGALAETEVAETAETEMWSAESERRLSRAVGTLEIIAWNDAPGRTWEEVAAVVEAYDRLTMLEGHAHDVA